MDAVYLHDGDRIDHTPSSAVSAGDVVALSKVFGIATSDIPKDTLGSLATRGVFALKKKASEAIATVGTLVYWDPAAGVTATAGSLKAIGYTVAAAASADATVKVLVLPGLNLAA